MEKINNLSRGKACLGEKVRDSEGNIGTIINYELRNGKKGFVEITYEDGTSHWREKYAVERGIFKKPYFYKFIPNIIFTFALHLSKKRQFYLFRTFQ